ncbi:tRNA:m(4)X modification enzyme TRM13 [Haplosporangium bisporale]|nr:tRNA:m(4)X modification enzyme TRM13 [Haplosporangium bisporale]
MADSKRPLESKDPKPIIEAMAGTLDAPVLHPRNRTKRQKVQAPLPPVPDRPRQCHFFLPGKRKYCSLTARMGNKYCGEHHFMAEAEAKKTNNSDSNEEHPVRKRIPCPFDPSHTVWEDDMKPHLYKCNARPKENPSLFCKDVNLTLQPEEAPTATTGVDLLGKLSHEKLAELIQKIRDLHAKYVPEIGTSILSHSALDERKKITKNIKHAHQQASLLGHMDRLQMLSDPTTCFVEFGAGRGELSAYLKMAMDDHGSGTFVLVDRTPPRNKFDNSILGLEEIKSLVKRHTIDIKDLVLAEVPELRRDVTATQREVPVKEVTESIETNDTTDKDTKEPEYVEKKPVVAVSKHLCGGATDITLKCLTSYQESECKNSPLPSPVKGILIALCCHQLCHHYMYPNQAFLKEIGITPQEFVYLTRMSSWAVCVNPTKSADASGESKANEPAGEEEHHVEADKELDELRTHIPGLDFDAREKLGQQCKRLLDIGRVMYLRENGFDAELVYYVDKETSLENLALMAVPKQ